MNLVRHCVFVTDGVWSADLLRGVAAWVRQGSNREEQIHQVMLNSSSTAMVKIRAGLQELEWAMSNNILEVCIQTNCAVFVQGLKNP